MGGDSSLRASNRSSNQVGGGCGRWVDGESIASVKMYSNNIYLLLNKYLVDVLTYIQIGGCKSV